MLPASSKPPAHLREEEEEEERVDGEAEQEGADTAPTLAGFEGVRHCHRGERGGAGQLAYLPGPLRAVARVSTNCWFCFGDYGKGQVFHPGHQE